MPEEVTFSVKTKHNIHIGLELIDGNVVLMMNDLEIGYFDGDRGLVLLPECTYNNNIPTTILDERGYLKIEKG